jgi:hypothetical protein
MLLGQLRRNWNASMKLFNLRRGSEVIEECRILEAHCHSILLEQEQMWHLKIRALWLEAGD